MEYVSMVSEGLLNGVWGEEEEVTNNTEIVTLISSHHVGNG